VLNNPAFLLASEERREDELTAIEEALGAYRGGWLSGGPPFSNIS
jgi:hypothetical protein